MRKYYSVRFVLGDSNCGLRKVTFTNIEAVDIADAANKAGRLLFCSILYTDAVELTGLIEK